jgi:membrane protease YdiL (CAAX protease family)
MRDEVSHRQTICQNPSAVTAQPTPAWLIFFHALGGLMPLITTILLFSRQHTPQEQRDYWQRIMDYTRMRERCYAVILLMVPGLAGLSVVGDVALGRRGVELETAAHFVEHPLAVVPFAVFLWLFGPVPEELACCEYALEQWQQRMKNVMYPMNWLRVLRIDLTS